jgi:DNA adenine methylase
VIGGKAQSGAWTLDARYNKHDLVQRITRIARLRDRILIYRMDAAHFITTVVPTVTSKALVYIDPPYMNRGKDLYWNTYEAADHARLAKVVQETVAHPWIVTYDDAPATRRLYRDRARRTYQLSYSAATKTVGSEVMMFSLGLRMPRTGLPCQPSSTNA